ncbi:hypothetical protein [Pseudactinotalea sp. Z1748]|uniref:hypothetical protein n=1 Tax=Pseudactinotalea sp. Z1748 TaxID=3413027 RepID=UPI003C7AFAB1
MEPITRPEGIALLTLLTAGVLLAAWVLLAPPTTGVDGRTFLAVGIGGGAAWLVRDRV